MYAIVCPTRDALLVQIQVYQSMIENVDKQVKMTKSIQA